MSRIVFLDIDGVLVTARLLKQRNGRNKCADDAAVSALNHLTFVAGAQIVISSSWRFCGQNEMQAILDFWGVDAPIVGMTPDLTRLEGRLYKAVPRGHEIQQYLDEHPEVERFVILDDECDMAHLERYMVKTKFDCGLTLEDAERAIKMLSHSAKWWPGKGPKYVAPTGAGCDKYKTFWLRGIRNERGTGQHAKGA